MKQKLFTLLTLLLVGISTAWGEDFTIVPTFSQNYPKLSYGLVDITLDGSGNKISSSAINAGSKGANAEFTISTTKSDIYLKTITFSNISNATLSIKEGSDGSYDSGTSTFTAAANQTTATFLLTNTKSGSTSSVKVPSIVVDGGANDIETLTMSGVTDGTISKTAKIDNTTVTSAVTLTTTGASVSEGILSWSNNKNITFTSDNDIKYIAFLTKDDKIISSNSLKIGDTKLTTASWTGSQKSITFTNATGATRTISKIFVVTIPATPTLTGAWKIGEETVTEANVIQGASAPTVPTFTVGATSGTPTTDNYTVAYSLKDGSTAGIITFTDGVPTAISTSTAGTATIVATLTTKDASAFLTPATNTFEYTVTVSAATAASITTHPASGVATVGVEKILTVVASGTPSEFTYQWYECDDADKTNPTIVGTNSASYSFTPSAVGTRYFYVTVSNGVGDAAVSNVATITSSLPQVATPTITTYGHAFRITCGTSGATIYYTVDDDDPKAAESKYTFDASANSGKNCISLAATGTIYAYAVADGYSASDVASQAITIPTVGSVTGNLMMTIQPDGVPSSDTQYDSNSFSNAGYTLATGTGGSYYLANTGLMTNYSTIMFKTKKGDFTITPPSDVTIQSVKIIGYSNNDLTTSTISVKDGYTLVSSSGVIVPRYCYYPGTTTGVENEVVISKNSTSAGGTFVFTVGGSASQQRFCVEVYGTTSAVNEAITPGKTYTTYIPSHNLDFTSHAKLKAYIATAATTSTVTMTSVNKVPAGTPIVLKATETGSAISVPIATSTDNVSSNKLKIGDGKTTIGGDSRYDYILSDGKFYRAESGTVAVGKAYLHLDSAPSSGEAHTLDIVFEESGNVTGINDVRSKMADVRGEYYNLNGQKVKNPTKGLYIVNGKKVIIK